MGFGGGVSALTLNLSNVFDVLAENSIGDSSASSITTSLVGVRATFATGFATRNGFGVTSSWATLGGARLIGDRGREGGESGIAYGSSAPVCLSEYARVSLRLFIATSSSCRRPSPTLELPVSGWLCDSLAVAFGGAAGRAFLLAPPPTVRNLILDVEVAGRGRGGGWGCGWCWGSGEAECEVEAMLEAETSVAESPLRASPFPEDFATRLAALPYVVTRFLGGKSLGGKS